MAAATSPKAAEPKGTLDFELVCRELYNVNLPQTAAAAAIATFL